MPLPFMKPKQVAGLIIQHRNPDGKPDSAPEDQQDQALESAAEDLILQFTPKTVESVAAALRAAFEIVDSEPHEEGPHDEPETSEGE